MGAILLQCSIQAPEISVTGEKTALQNQVLGTFEQIENETWVIASTRAIGGAHSSTMSDHKRRVLEAVRNRKFNKDEIDELKKDKVIGEDLKGFLQILPTSRYEEEENYRRLVDELVKVENDDRFIIYERVIAVNSSASEAGDKVYDIFAKLNYDNSKPGTMIQQDDETWKEK